MPVMAGAGVDAVFGERDLGAVDEQLHAAFVVGAAVVEQFDSQCFPLANVWLPSTAKAAGGSAGRIIGR